MIGERIAFLIGLFGLPTLILMRGHRFRERSSRERRIFWGAVLGHAGGLIVTVVFALFPPIWWHEGPLWRDFLVHWSMLIAALSGALIGWIAARKRKAPAS